MLLGVGEATAVGDAEGTDVVVGWRLADGDGVAARDARVDVGDGGEGLIPVSRQAV